ncbi:hypothetical protein [Rhizobium leguminosarum]|uniref:hypothetical protein n=1 Tax=Rhizobium leguminosarum TaxID=384 RepID=UPI001FE01D71|nr:hypothetical protein [Rhizobium leguminosarum]
MNEVIFQQAEENALEPVELNADVELLIESLSDRLTEDSSRAYLRQFASLVRDPLGEDREQSESEAHAE